MNKQQFIQAVSAERVSGESLRYRIPQMYRSELEKRVGQAEIYLAQNGAVVLKFALEDGTAVILAPANDDNLIKDANVLIG